MALNDDAISLLDELQEHLDALPANTPYIARRYADDYNNLIDQIEAATGTSLGRFRIEEDEIQSSADRLRDVMGAAELGDVHKYLSKPQVSVDLLRSKGKRLVGSYKVRMRNAIGMRDQHITIAGDGNQMVVGIAGGPLQQDVTYQVRAGDDAALLEGLKRLGIDQNHLSTLAEVIKGSPDEPTKREGVRSWLKDFVTDTLSGTLSAAAASQLPSAVALGMGYLS